MTFVFKSGGKLLLEAQTPVLWNFDIRLDTPDNPWHTFLSHNVGSFSAAEQVACLHAWKKLKLSASFPSSPPLTLTTFSSPRHIGYEAPLYVVEITLADIREQSFGVFPTCTNICLVFCGHVTDELHESLSKQIKASSETGGPWLIGKEHLPHIKNNVQQDTKVT